MPFRAFVFARPSGPAFGGIEFGHVGWGFQIDAARYLVGSVENPAGTPVSPPGKTGFWSDITTNPFARFAAGPLGEGSAYDAYKEIPLEQPQVAAAEARVREVSTQGYAVTGANCMDAVHSILRAYGVWNLPNPANKENYLPNAWFQHIAHPARPLAQPRAPLDVVLYEHPEFQGERLQLVSSAQQLRLADLAERGWLRRASSLVVRSGRLTLHTAANFGGSSIVLESGSAYPFLGGWARVMWSLQLQAPGLPAGGVKPALFAAANTTLGTRAVDKAGSIALPPAPLALAAPPSAPADFAEAGKLIVPVAPAAPKPTKTAPSAPKAPAPKTKKPRARSGPPPAKSKPRARTRARPRTKGKR